MNYEKFKSIKPTEISENSIQLIGYDWMLITAGEKDSVNTMTAAWGGIGFLWKKPVAFIFIRPQRHTFKFTEKYDDFTLSFFDEKYRSILNYCGTKSGKDSDKINECGLTALETPSGNIFFEESKLIIECRKLYFDDIKPEKFIDKKIDNLYPINDYHRIYVGEIVNCFQKRNIN